jgi:hypothetical protein
VSKYELDDDLVREIANGDWIENTAINRAATALRPQVPIPIPTKIGAVVRTESGDVFTLTSAHRLTDSVWIAPNGFHAAPEEIGRITEVLSEGVDL